MEDKYLLTEEIIFDAKPNAVPYNYRISYKIAQLCLIIDMCSKRGGCSLIKLHLISTGLNTKEDMQKLIDFAYDQYLTYHVVRFDPVVNRAIRYSLAEELIIQQKDGKFRLTPKGKDFVKRINRIGDLMTKEKEFLSKLSDLLTEKKIRELMMAWRYHDDKN
jgi:hypothetical protein